jgi:hypothetical protein
MKAIPVPGAALGPAGPDISDLWRMVRELQDRVDRLEEDNAHLRGLAGESPRPRREQLTRGSAVL